MRYLQSGSFSSQVGTSAAQKSYRENWALVFGQEEEQDPDPVEDDPPETSDETISAD